MISPGQGGVHVVLKPLTFEGPEIILDGGFTEVTCSSLLDSPGETRTQEEL